MNLIRLDQIHGVPPLKEEYFFSEANPFLPHEEGKGLREKMKEALEEIYSLLQVGKENAFVFTSSGEEAVTQVIQGVLLSYAQETGRNQCVSSRGEIASILGAKEKISLLGGVSRDILLNEEGIITKENYIKSITPRTGLLSFSLVNPLTGVIQLLEEIRAISQERGILVHIDVTHALGKIALSWEDLQADFITFGGETIGAPLGTGGLFIHKKHPSFPSLIFGGYDQAGLRGGVYNPVLFCMLGKACDQALKKLDHCLVDVAHLRYLFEKNLSLLIPDSKVLFNALERAPHISLVSFPPIFQENLFYLLSQKGVLASMGGGAFLRLPFFLQNFPQILKEEQDTALNFSFSARTTEEEIHHAVKKIAESYTFLLQET